MSATELVYQRCIRPECATTQSPDDTSFACPKCKGLMDVAYDWDRLPVPKSLKEFEKAWQNRSNPLDFSGVWRFRKLLPFAPEEKILTIGEGQTLLQKADCIGKRVGMNEGKLFLQYEGMNPSGSFKDNGMTAAFSHARMTGAKRAACASTGNTSASLAIYCSATSQMKGIVFMNSERSKHKKELGCWGEKCLDQWMKMEKLKNLHSNIKTMTITWFGILMYPRIN
jgi:threonine synthase